MKAMFWTFIGVLMTANIAMADVIPDPSFQEKAERFFDGIEIHPEVSALAIGLIVGSAATWLIMRSRKKNGSNPK